MQLQFLAKSSSSSKSFNMFKFTTFVLILAAVASVYSDAEITFTETDVPYTYTDDQPNLPHIGVTQTCKTGVWIVFTGANYYGGLMTELLPKIEYSCHSVAPIVGSTRLAGLRPDYNTPSVTLFTGTKFGGDSHPFGNAGLSSINFPIASMVTINTQVEFFQSSNFGGQSLCLENPFCDGGVCWMWDFSTEQYPWDIRNAKSARAGCSAGAIVFKIQHNNGSTISIL